MSGMALLKRMLPAGLKRAIRRNTVPGKLAALVSAKLSPCICIDIGASYYPHFKWNLFLASSATQWIAVEPNERNLGYIRTWSHPAKVTPVTTGLSERGGRQTLYVTHVDSGSSLLEPVIQPGMKHRITRAAMEYFFPVRPREIDTITLSDVIAMGSAATPVFVKLDTQGTELSILRGAMEYLAESRIVGIEMESTLLAQPVMSGSGKFWQACQFLEKAGFELLDINPIQAPSVLYKRRPSGRRFLNECDAVFALRRDVAQRLPVGHRVALFGFYVANKLFEEALSMIETDESVRRHVAGNDAEVEEWRRLLRAAA